MFVGTAFHTSKLKRFRHRLEEMGEDRVKDLLHAVRKGS